MPMLLIVCAKVSKRLFAFLHVAHHVVLDRRVQVVLILAAIFAVYYPSLRHAPRADTFIFLAYTSGTDEFVPLVLGTYALNRGSFSSRLLIDHYGTNPSKTPAMSWQSFKPLFWMSLGMCKWLFGYNFWLWQLVGVLAHCGIVLLVWALLRRVSEQNSLIPLVFSIFLGVSWASIEMVVWQCCIGNRLCLTLVTWSILCYYQSVSGGKASSRWLSALLASFSLFFWEFGGAVAAVLCVALFITSFRSENDSLAAPIYEKRKSRGALWRIVTHAGPSLVIFCAFAAYAVLYAVFDFIDLDFRIGLANIFSFESLKITEDAPFERGFLYSMVYTNLYWLALMFFPSLAPLRCGGRIEGPFPNGPISFSHCNFWCVIAWLLLVMIVIAAISVRDRHRRRRMYSFLVLLLGILVAYTFMIYFYRVRERGLYFALSNAIHYAYVWGLFVVLISGFVVSHAERFGGRFGRLISRSIIILTIVMVCYSGSKTYAMNVLEEKWSRPRMKLLKKVEELITKQGNESDFSFAVEEQYPNIHINFLPSRPRLIRALYYTSYNTQSPKYLISLDIADMAPLVRGQVTLVQKGYCGYNIIKLDHRFMAIRQDLGRLDFWNGRLADVKAWPYIISGDATVAVNEEIVKRGGDISQYKVFDYKGGVVAANVLLGKVDPTTELIGTRELPPFLFVGWTKEEVLKKVDTRSEK